MTAGAGPCPAAESRLCEEERRKRFRSRSPPRRRFRPARPRRQRRTPTPRRTWWRRPSRRRPAAMPRPPAGCARVGVVVHRLLLRLDRLRFACAAWRIACSDVTGEASAPRDLPGLPSCCGALALASAGGCALPQVSRPSARTGPSAARGRDGPVRRRSPVDVAQSVLGAGQRLLRLRLVRFGLCCRAAAWDSWPASARLTASLARCPAAADWRFSSSARFCCFSACCLVWTPAAPTPWRRLRPCGPGVVRLPLGRVGLLLLLGRLAAGPCGLLVGRRGLLSSRAASVERLVNLLLGPRDRPLGLRGLRLRGGGVVEQLLGGGGAARGRRWSTPPVAPVGPPAAPPARTGP